MKALDLYRFQEIFIRIKDLQIFRSSHRRCPETCNFIKKETPSQVFSCEFCEISNNTFFTEHLRTTASVHLNINSLLLKIEELRIIAKATNPAIIGISESKLDESILEPSIQIDDYKILRCDGNRHGGGVAFYTRNMT